MTRTCMKYYFFSLIGFQVKIFMFKTHTDRRAEKYTLRLFFSYVSALFGQWSSGAAVSQSRDVTVLHLVIISTSVYLQHSLHIYQQCLDRRCALVQFCYCSMFKVSFYLNLSNDSSPNEILDGCTHKAHPGGYEKWFYHQIVQKLYSGKQWTTSIILISL